MADEAVRIEPSLGPGFAAPAAGASVLGPSPSASAEGRPDPVIRITPAETYLDLTTIFSLMFSVLLIAVAIAMGRADANFLDIPSILIVILGTIAVTCMSYTGRELKIAWPIISGSFVRAVYDPTRIARELLDISVLSRKRGFLYLSSLFNELQKNPFLFNVVQMVTDGMTGSEIDRLTHQEIDVTVDRYRKAAGILRRASEIAPAMGLIGTLIGLVQMLVSMDDPASIGPAMALALLTTFYGAIMGSVVLAPLAAKLERNANEDMLVKTMIQMAAIAIVSQENPRKLEMELNALLPPDQRIKYFDF